MALEFKILKNMPEYNSYGQYYYVDEGTEDFWQDSGAGTTNRSDDIYTTIIDEGTINDETNEPDWRPISNVYVGNPQNVGNPNNVFIQKYYEFGSNDYLKASAPNLVHLYFDIALNDKNFNINYDNYYNSRTGNIGVKILNWDWVEGDSNFSNDFVSSVDAEYMDLYQNDNTTPNVLSHQYTSPGLKIIKAAVYSTDDVGRIRYKHLEIRLVLGLDGIFVEDFMDIGGPDFTYLPWPMTTPIIGGISEDSNYFKSVESIINSNPFYENEKFEKYYAEKAFYNDELGMSLGDTDIEQVRTFRGSWDMSRMLGIQNAIVIGNEFNPYNNFSHWDGESNSFPVDNSVGKLFIDESEDLTLSNECLFELNCGDINISNILDTSGNGNKGILVGDYKVTKDIGLKSRRESVIKTPKTDNKNGAI